MRLSLTHQIAPAVHPAGPGGRAATGAARLGAERGVILPLMAMSMVSLLLLATVVIDGSHAYPQRRGMQNAADAASLAATRAFDKARFSGGAWSAIDQTATAVAADNGAESSVCTIVTNAGAPVGPCGSSLAIGSPAAAGVKVEAVDVRETSFGGITGQNSVTARARATSTVQTFVGTGGGIPFIICGNPSLGGYPILRPDGTVDAVAATAMGTVPVQGSGVPTCGAGSAFKGKIKMGEVIDSLPADVAGDNGNGFNGDIQVTVLGSTPCTADDVADLGADGTVACDLILPIADSGYGNGNSIGLHAVAWAVFHVSGDGRGNPKYSARFVGTNAYVSGGRTSITLPTSGATPRSIRLIG